MKLNITTIINGHEIPRTHILDWEKHRAKVVLKKLGVQPIGEDLATLQSQLMARKQMLGTDGLLNRLRLDLALSSPTAALTAYLSRGARRFSVTELVVSSGTAEQFVDWFNQRAQINDEQSMIAATPDHYIIRTAPDGSQEVIETNGGSPLAARFFIDYQDLSSLRSAVEPSYPLQIAGVAKTKGGMPIGGVRHQFRNEGNGFRARLLVEFPLLILPQVISGHQWHLASEFSHWIEAAFA
ncbi:hypothetical protein C8N29_1028 [Agitococcus lubricus]|uniref:Uncharacterized protein n=2 Tax=Agitococcus lubricus TaxID=1077255 RepID=A0A2T5J270_9GAMM|nr:hypothetical protein C8N29_1028 [Agitococcus lubricus]